jgi:hypothetical protein
MRFGFSRGPFFVLFEPEYLLWTAAFALAAVFGIIMFPFAVVHIIYVLLGPTDTYFGIACLTIVILVGCGVKIGSRLELKTVKGGRAFLGLILLGSLYLFSYGGIVWLAQPGDTPGTWPPAYYHRVAHAVPRTSSPEAIKHF